MKLVAVVLLLAPLVTTCLGQSVIRANCNAIHQQDPTRTSGVHDIQPAGQTTTQVYCDMTTAGGGWTVIQRRMDGSLNFYRPWAQYKNGFGNVTGEYWLGLDNINSMTTANTELRVEMEDFQGTIVSARYSSFSVGAESSDYELTVTGFIDGGAGDSLSYHSGQKFSTFDNDQDSSSNNCARSHLGAFWYNDCHQANPNGVYIRGADSTHDKIGVEWFSWKGRNYSLKNITMMIR